MLKSKVLLPSDGSSTSLKAAAYAARLMKMNKDMKLSVLVVLPGDSIWVNTNNGGENIMEPLAREIQDRGREILQKTVEIFRNEGLSVDGVIDRGDPAEVILAHAERGNFDHIIMGSRGVSELRGVELGSVSHKVIHLANCRVTLLNRQSAILRTYRTIRAESKILFPEKNQPDHMFSRTPRKGRVC